VERLSPPAPVAAPTLDPARTADLAHAVRARLAELFANAPKVSGPPPGVQIAYAEGDRVVYAESVGLADAARGRPLTNTHAFTLASQSKPVAAVLAVRMAAAGLIDLDAPAMPLVRGWSPAPDQSAGFDAHAVTVRQLLAHTSGWDLRGFPMWPARDAARAPTVAALLSGAAGDGYRARMQFDPGRTQLYSGAGYAILQLALEGAGGAPYAELLDRHVARPLGWRSTWAGWDPSRTAALATGHAATTDRAPVERSFYPALAPSGLFGTASELAALWSLVAATALGDDSAAAGFVSGDAARAMLTACAPPGPDVAFGLGFALTEWAGLTVFKHAGWCPGFWGTTEGLAELGVAASVQCSMSEPGGKFVAQRLCGFILERARALHGRPAPPRPPRRTA
jgi:CubicO group peptidase (beta-lactamase class C family)